jgi:hypothetical protein
MSFAWGDYLTVAEALVHQRGTLAPEDACCRAAISRAYYAAYGAARNHARDVEGLRLAQTGDDHQRVLGHYLRAATPAPQAIGALLFRLRQARAQADYADTLPNVVPRAYAALRRARRVGALVEALQG